MKQPVWDKKTIVSKAAHFTVGSAVFGDYYEFGVFKGNSTISAYWAFRYAYESLLENYSFLIEDWNRQKMQSNWNKMKFHCLDSFEGLPEINGIDNGGPFSQGDYSTSIEVVKENLSKHNVDLEKVVFWKGWFKDIQIAEPRKASVIHIDCDLYESTRDALNLCTGLIQDGTVIMFDDWFQFKASPQKGEQKAFHDWIKSLNNQYIPVEYAQEDIWRKSFILSQNTEQVDGSNE